MNTAKTSVLKGYSKTSKLKNQSPLFPAGVVTARVFYFAPLGLQEDESFFNIIFSLSDHIMQFFWGKGGGASRNFLIRSTKSLKILSFLTKLDSVTND